MLKKKCISFGVMIANDMLMLIYNKEFKMYLVRMFEDNKLIKSIPMISEATIHSERFAEDAAENWCLGYIE